MTTNVLSRRDEILATAARHGAGRVRVFGSYARGEAGDASDLDLLVDVVGKQGPWFPAGLEVELEDLLGIAVDVVTEAGLHPDVREYVLRDARPL